jgi:hypothetical protein
MVEEIVELVTKKRLLKRKKRLRKRGWNIFHTSFSSGIEGVAINLVSVVEDMSI